MSAGRTLRAAWRLLQAVGQALYGYWLVRWRFPRISAAAREDGVQQWSIGMLRVLGITLEVQGEVPVNGPLLLVSNHISWLDIVALHAARHCRFVSKADVQHWPVIGSLAHGAGTLFVQRESRRDAMRVVHHMADALRAGDVLAIFPEGTTSDGNDVLPFHANLFQAAISAHAEVQVLGLRYVDAQSGEPSHATDYVGDDSLFSSVWRTLIAPPLTARLRFGVRLSSVGLERRALAAASRDAVLGLR